MAPIDAATPALLRRRVTPLGQLALKAAWSLPECAASRIVVSSRHGEYRRTLSILEALADEAEISPADFTLSVHNALAGLLSIALGNQLGHVAMAAGPDSFCFGLMEALACVADRPWEPVILLHYDEKLPGAYETFADADDGSEVLALVLAADGPGEAFGFAAAPLSESHPLPGSPVRDFLHFLLEASQDELVLRGKSLKFRWWRHAQAH
jgi:hypothetical protein